MIVAFSSSLRSWPRCGSSPGRACRGCGGSPRALSGCATGPARCSIGGCAASVGSAAATGRSGWLVTLFVASLFLELLVNGEALAIHYQGKTAFPAVAEWIDRVLPIVEAARRFERSRRLRPDRRGRGRLPALPALGARPRRPRPGDPGNRADHRSRARRRRTGSVGRPRSFEHRRVRAAPARDRPRARRPHRARPRRRCARRAERSTPARPGS